MADQLYLSYRIAGWTVPAMLRSYEVLLRTFPFSRLSTASSTFRIDAVASGEPPLFEESVAPPVNVDAALAVIREFASPDISAVLEADWDLWQFDREWKLMPARVSLICFGPDFESVREDELRIEFGIDTHFLPQIDLSNYLFMAQSNIRSLLHLVHELDSELNAETRRLWTESGENFAARLQSLVMDDQPGESVQ